MISDKLVFIIRVIRVTSYNCDNFANLMISECFTYYEDYIKFINLFRYLTSMNFFIYEKIDH